MLNWWHFQCIVMRFSDSKRAQGQSLNICLQKSLVDRPDSVTRMQDSGLPQLSQRLSKASSILNVIRPLVGSSQATPRQG